MASVLQDGLELTALNALYMEQRSEVVGCNLSKVGGAKLDRWTTVDYCVRQKDYIHDKLFPNHYIFRSTSITCQKLFVN